MDSKFNYFESENNKYFSKSNTSASDNAAPKTPQLVEKKLDESQFEDYKLARPRKITKRYAIK